MTLFDLIAGGILLVSGFIGYVRGAAREVITVLALLIATAASLVLLRFTGPIARSALHPDWIGNAAALLVVFVIIYVIIRVIASAVSRRMRDVPTLGVLDRTVGFGFGLVRGIVALGAFVLVFSLATPPDRMPPWITGSWLYPLSASAANVLRAIAPEGSRLAGRVGPVLQRAVREGRGPDEPPGQTEEQRKAMDDVVERSR
jgi:membrane protein required for colicin V production